MWSFIYRTLRKCCQAIDEARKIGTYLIVNAAHITDKLGDEVTLTERCSEAGVILSIAAGRQHIDGTLVVYEGSIVIWLTRRGGIPPEEGQRSRQISSSATWRIGDVRVTPPCGQVTN